MLPWVLYVLHGFHARGSARWKAMALVAALFLPVVMMAGMVRPFGGPPWGLVDWIPD